MRLCREKIGGAKTQLELNLATAVKGNKNVSINTEQQKEGSGESLSFIGCRAGGEAQ